MEDPFGEEDYDSDAATPSETDLERTYREFIEAIAYDFELEPEWWKARVQEARNILESNPQDLP